MTNLTREDRDRMRELESEVTIGPWRWVVNLKHRAVILEGPPRKMLETVIDFVRWGMGGATPRFRNSSDVMAKAEMWAAPVEGREHHESWYRRITHPDAVFIEEARTFIPRALAALDERDKLLREVLRFGLDTPHDPAMDSEADELEARIREAIGE